MSAPTQARPPRPAWNAATVVGMLIGAATLAWCATQAWQTTAFLARASRADGVVVRSSGHPTIRFATAPGHDVEFVQNGGLDRDAGDHVPVLYDAAAPADSARAGTFFAVWGSTLWGLPMGIGFLVLPLFGARFVATGRHGNALKR